MTLPALEDFRADAELSPFQEGVEMLQYRRLLLACLLALGLTGGWTWREVWYWSRYDALSMMVSTPNPTTYTVRVSSEQRPSDDDPELFPGTVHALNGRLPIERLDASTSCGLSGCHPDITKQWQQSMHHFASFNNPLYRQSVTTRATARATPVCAGARAVTIR